MVVRLRHVGFEVRAELQTGEAQPWVQLTRGEAENLDLREGAVVWLRPNHVAQTLIATS
jgi:sulfate transport system ATP-binding protein